MLPAENTEDFEDRYHNAPCGYLSVAPDGLIAKTNQTFANWTGLPRDDLVGSRFHDWLPIAGKMFYETHLLPLLRIQGFVNEVALDFVFADGRRLAALVNFAERRDDRGGLRYVRMIVSNATDRRRYERDLLAARASAQAATSEIGELNLALQARIADAEASRLKAEALLRQAQKMEAIGQLTGGIAHDFNNLLAGITGNLELLERRISQGRLDSLPRYVIAARGAAKRAAGLTHRLLAFSRRQQLELQATDVNRLIGNLEEMLRRSLGGGAQLEFIGAAGLWTTMIDQNQLENAVLNLCINARDAMPAGGRVTIETSNKWLDQTIATQRDMQAGQYVELCVTDTGTGMSADVLARAFDPFFTTKPSGVGTGLGLAMVHAFARQAGGQVRIYSELDRGTTICIYLPRHRGPPEEPEALVMTSGTFVALHAATILIVDDEPSVRVMVADMMMDAGYRTAEAPDAATALRVLETSARFDLLITDVGLPGAMSGRQLADTARQSREDLKVLFITGYAENAAVENGFLAPGSHVLTKPFSGDALAQAVSALLPPSRPSSGASGPALNRENY